MSKSFYITTTLPYVNASLHMGHALEFIRADIIARFKKSQNFDVYFNTGTDEHGMKIYEKAIEKGKDPQSFVDEQFNDFCDAIKIFGLDHSIIHFTRTTDKRHERIAKDLWMRCYNNNFIYKKNYITKYCVGCESEKTDFELINGECEDHPGKKLEIIEEDNYFFRYGDFGEKLLSFYKENPNFVIPDFRFNEIKLFIERGLQDFSISRLKSKMSWGIEVPNDKDHVMYVWFDALTNYISTFADDNTLTIEDLLANDKFQKFWVNGTPTQYCGKDNLRFQSAMWQAMLMASGLPNSHQIVIDGFITAEGGVKMSKSLGNVVDPKEIVEQYGVDALRLFLVKEVSSFEDSPFTIERFKEAYNANLANGLGNLVSRVLKMTTINSVILTDEDMGEIEREMEKEKENNAGSYYNYISFLEIFEINKACDEIWKIIKDIDKDIQDKKPFSLIKTDKEKAKGDLFQILSGLYKVAKMLEIIIPETSSKIQNLIRENKIPESPLFLRKE